MANNIILDLVNFLVAVVITFFSIILYHPINKRKLYKTKEDQLIIQKSVITTLFFFSIIVTYILLIFEVFNRKEVFLVIFFFFNVYIMDVVLYNLFLAYELYSTFINPVHLFNRILKQQKHNYKQEFFIFLVSLITLAVDFFLYKKSSHIQFNDYHKEFDKSEKYVCNASSLFAILNWKCFFIIIISFISLIYCYKIKSKLQKFCFKNQEKALKLIGKRKMSNYLYFFYGLFYLLPSVSFEKIHEKYNMFGSIFFMIIIFNDFMIHISAVSTTKFCEYRLKRTLLQYFCSFFYEPPKYNNSATTPLVNEGSINDGTGMSTFQNETTALVDLMATNPNDKEIVPLFKNGMFIEDYFFNYFDQILNIITGSLFHVYNSNHFSSQAKDQELKNQFGGDISSIGGTMQSLTVSNIGPNNKTIIKSIGEVGDDVTRFNIIKNNNNDDLHRFKEVLEDGIDINHNNNFLNIKIKSYFTPRCVESIYDQRIKGRHVGTSLLSHMILSNTPKNRNINNPNAYYWSLFGANGKEEYFNKLRATSIKTYDKQFILDIFETNDEDINDKGNNKDLAYLLDKYFTYIHGKGINGTFIPSLVGVFKIKINDFKTLLVLITKNSLVENAPKNFFTYWQLIRFLESKPQKLASSQFSSGGTLVKDDPIFERSFQIQTKKENPNFNKIQMKNYHDFEETILSDLEFLRQCGSENFDLLLMYYEYENTQKHEKQGAITIKKTQHGAELIEGSLPKDLVIDESNSPIEKSKIPDSLGGGVFSMGDNFFDDNEFGGKNSSNKNIANFKEIDDKSNIASFEGIFDSFNCLCYFTFENVFDLRKRLSLAINYYNNFKKRVLVNFAEYIKSN